MEPQNQIVAFTAYAGRARQTGEPFLPVKLLSATTGGRTGWRLHHREGNPTVGVGLGQGSRSGDHGWCRNSFWFRIRFIQINLVHIKAFNVLPQGNIKSCSGRPEKRIAKTQNQQQGSIKPTGG